MAGEEAFLAAAAEHKEEPRYLEVLGGKFELSKGPDAITWLELCAVGKKSVHSPEGASALLNVARACFTDTGWEGFRAAVRAEGIDDNDELESLISKALAVINGRPTTPSSGSESGSSPTSPGSTGTSSGKRRKAEVSSA